MTDHSELVRAALQNVVELSVHDSDMVLAVFGDNPNGPSLFDDVATSLRESCGRPLDPGCVRTGWPPKVYVLAGFVFTCSDEWRQIAEEPGLKYRIRALWGELDVAAFSSFCASTATQDGFERDTENSTEVPCYDHSHGGPYSWLLDRLEVFLGKPRASRGL